MRLPRWQVFGGRHPVNQSHGKGNEAPRPFPTPAASWADSSAPRPRTLSANPWGPRDCLYLNIWRPAAGEERLPVFVYVHGGMNSVGQASTGLYHGAHLAGQAGAVVVTINYRLGPLGFFFHKSLESGDPRDDSGNYGLLDIIQALAWIQSNIDAFGGDPDKVTVGGESAGAFNVCSLLGTPLAKGLFHGAFAISPCRHHNHGYPGSGPQGRGGHPRQACSVRRDSGSAYSKRGPAIHPKPGQRLGGPISERLLTHCPAQ